MLTRIEIDGFKTFEDFSLDLGPFTVILGANASGKSNLFDAIRLLSNLAWMDLRRAPVALRGQVSELFRRASDSDFSEIMRFAVEVNLDPTVTDPWGREVGLSHTRVRYELDIERRKNKRGLQELAVAREVAEPITYKDDHWVSARGVSKSFSERFLKYGRRAPLLSTEPSEDGLSQIRIRQDGRPGRPLSFPMEDAKATVLSTVTTSEFPHLYALREELRSWRFLQLDPAALRRPSPALGVAEELEPNGQNLAFVLARIKAETGSEDRPQGDLPEITAALANVIPGIVNLDVLGDDPTLQGVASEIRDGGSGREYRIDISMQNGAPFSSRVVSDGTLRVLALLTLLHDPLHRGLLLFEEPENGIHPARLHRLVEQLRHLVTDPASDDLDPEEPLSQLVVNSHSPVLLSALTEGSTGVRPDVVFADLVTRVDPQRQVTRARTRMRPVEARDQGRLQPEGATIGRFEVQRFLATVNQAAI